MESKRSRSAARVVGDELRYIVDDTCDGDEAATVGSLFHIVVPFYNGQLFERHAPVEPRTLLVELFLRLLEATLFNLVLLELLQVVGQTDGLAGPDEPLGWVVLLPFDCVPVVRRKLVVEVVVSAAKKFKKK